MKTWVFLATLTLGVVCLHGEDFHYLGACDGSAGVAIGSSHLLVANDETDILRLYRIGTPRWIGRLDLTADLSVGNSEADIEGASRVQNSPLSYWITSHGRNKKGKIKEDRYRLFGLLLEAGPSSAPTLRPMGQPYRHLVQDMLESASWERPTQAVLDALTAATRLSESELEELAPKVRGLNIEGLATSPDDNRLLIGFRNPLIDGKALIVDLLNPEEVLYGRGGARFGEGILLDLGGLGIRAIEYSPLHGAYLIVAGPVGTEGPSSLAIWSGVPTQRPVSLGTIEASPGMNPESILVGDDGRIQLLFDEGSRTEGNKECKDLKKEVDQSFSIRDLDLGVHP